MPFDQLEKLPVVGGCLARLAALVFGAPFVAGGLHLWFVARGETRLVELALGLILLLTGALVLVPFCFGYKSAARPLAIVWVVLLGLFLLGGLVAKMLGFV